MMRVLLVDDERLARKELRRLLAAHACVEIIGEAATVAEALAQTTSLRPDLVLLNIQMPDGSGYDLLDTLEHAPEIIFTTGYGGCPPESLLKPVRPHELAAALERASIRLGMVHRPRKLFIRDGDHCWYVRMTDIHLFESEGDRTRAYFDGGAPLVARTLAQLEQILNPQQFFRASLRHIVNLADVRRVRHTEDGALALNVAGVSMEIFGTAHHAV